MWAVVGWTITEDHNVGFVEEISDAPGLLEGLLGFLRNPVAALSQEVQELTLEMRPGAIKKLLQMLFPAHTLDPPLNPTV
ncbi:MAG: hypothetical protein V2G33_02845 [bacterium JZ-2024 1]